MSGPRPSPRLLIVARGAEDYGVATELLGLARGFSARAWSVVLYALGEGALLDGVVAQAGADVVLDRHVPHRFVRGAAGVLPSYARLLAGSTRFAGRLRSYLRDARPDAVLFCEHGLVLPMAVALRGSGTPAFWMMPNLVSGGYPADINRRLYAAAFRLGGIVPVANSRFTATTLGRAGGGAECVELGVDPAPFLNSAAPHDPLAAVVPPGKVRMVVMARLVPFKGQGMLLAAILDDPALADLHLVLCGGPLGSPYANALCDLAGTRGRADRLHLIGPTADPAGYLCAADLVASVRTTPEPFGLSIVEAMMAGKPVLAHAAGGPADIVLDGATGWLLPDMTPATLAHGLGRMWAARHRWPDMGRGGRTRALERFTVEAMTDRLFEVFARHGVRGCVTRGVSAQRVPRGAAS